MDEPMIHREAWQGDHRQDAAKRPFARRRHTPAFSVKALNAGDRLASIARRAQVQTSTRSKAMVARKSVKKPARKTATRKTAAARPTPAAKKRKSTAPANPVQKLLRAGMDAANRAQGEAARVYGSIALEARRLTELTNEAAQSLARRAGAAV